MITQDKPYLFQKGQTPWNKGSGGCKRGHDSALYIPMPSGTYVCLGCKRENGAKYREANRDAVVLRTRLGRYRMSTEDFNTLWRNQLGCCAICKLPLHEKKYRIDHNHQTGVVRGLLCSSCNSAIGLLKDSIPNLVNAMRYLNAGDT